MCLAQGPQRSDACEARTRGPSVSSQALYHWATTLPNLSKIDKTMILMTNGSLMKAESIAECSPLGILQYFWPALSDYRSGRPILVFFLSDRLRQVLLYISFCCNWSKYFD